MESPVKMVRDAKSFPESYEANVRPENVAAFEVMGWTRAGAVIVGDGIGTPLPPFSEGEKTAPASEIPTDWKSKHWKQRVALAKTLGWVDGEPTTEQADGWIADMIEHRRREEPQEALGGRSIREAHDIITKAGGEWTAETTAEELAELLQLAEA